jgi:hypothetical protein
MAGYLVFGVVFFLVPLAMFPFIAKVENQKRRKSLRRLMWLFFIVGFAAFMIYEGSHPPRNGSEIPISGSPY